MKRPLRNTTLSRGFSLIELLIVVAIILIVAAIAIPNLLRARVAANESSAAASVRTINTAQQSFQTAYPLTGYASNIATLGPADASCSAGPSSLNACLIDFVISQGTKSGYRFLSTGAGGPPADTFISAADPVTMNITGVKGFCGTEDHVVRYISIDAGAPSHATCMGATYVSIGQ